MMMKGIVELLVHMIDVEGVCNYTYVTVSYGPLPLEFQHMTINTNTYVDVCYHYVHEKEVDETIAINHLPRWFQMLYQVTIVGTKNQFRRALGFGKED